MPTAWTHSIAYVYTTGEVEGFVGTALSNKGMARDDALRKLRAKIQAIQVHRPEECFDEHRLIETESAAKRFLTAEQREQVNKDWEISKRSNTL